jgi:hypothetical protein
MAREILSKRNFFDFESPDSAISGFPMTLMKSMASLHQGPKVSNAKPLNTYFDEMIELYLLYLRLQAISAAKPETSDLIVFDSYFLVVENYYMVVEKIQSVTRLE